MEKVDVKIVQVRIDFTLGNNTFALSMKGASHNLLMNAGAMMSCSLIAHGNTIAERFDKVLKTWEALNGGKKVNYIGLPAKSASGALMLVIPNVMGISIWSPKLDELSNSAGGVEFCERLVEQFSFINTTRLQDVQLKISSLPLSVIRYPLSAIRYPLSAIRHPSPVIRHPSPVSRNPTRFRTKKRATRIAWLL